MVVSLKEEIEAMMSKIEKLEGEIVVFRAIVGKGRAIVRGKFSLPRPFQ